MIYLHNHGLAMLPKTCQHIRDSRISAAQDLYTKYGSTFSRSSRPGLLMRYAYRYPKIPIFIRVHTAMTKNREQSIAVIVIRMQYRKYERRRDQKITIGMLIRRYRRSTRYVARDPPVSLGE